MAQLGEAVDTSQYEDRPKFELIPLKTEAPMVITDSDVVPTKDTTGTLINLTLEIIDGPYKSRKLFVRINYLNASAKAQAIGRSQLKEICQAVGKLTFQDTQELHCIPFIGTVGIEKGTGTYDDKNILRSARHVNAPAPSARAAAAPATATAGHTTPPANTAAAAPAPQAGRPAAKKPWEK